MEEKRHRVCIPDIIFLAGKGATRMTAEFWIALVGPLPWAVDLLIDIKVKLLSGKPDKETK